MYLWLDQLSYDEGCAELSMDHELLDSRESAREAAISLVVNNNDCPTASLASVRVPKNNVVGLVAMEMLCSLADCHCVVIGQEPPIC